MANLYLLSLSFQLQISKKKKKKILIEKKNVWHIKDAHVFLMYTDTDFLSHPILDLLFYPYLNLVSLWHWSVSLLNWPEKERVGQPMRSGWWAAHTTCIKRTVQLTHIQVCGVFSELKESSTSTVEVESIHKKKSGKTGTAGKIKTFRKLKILSLIPITPRAIKRLSRNWNLHSRNIRETAISGVKYHLCPMGFPRIFNPASFSPKVCYQLFHQNIL